MTVGDLFTGAWTWGQLLRELYPLFLVAASAFWAGYERGCRVALRRVESERVARVIERSRLQWERGKR